MTAGSGITQKKDGRARMQPSTKGTKLGELKDVGIVPYQNLANAIVRQAVNNYKAQLHLLLKNPNNTDAMDKAQSIERFFHSGWYTALTSVDGGRLINGVRILVRKEAAEKEWKATLAESRKCRRQAIALRNGEPVPEVTGEKECTREEIIILAESLEKKAKALKGEAAEKKAKADELEAQAIKSVGFLVKKPRAAKKKGGSR